MEQRLSLITLGVEDLAESRRFYEALGWKASAIGDGNVVFFQLGGIALALWSRAELAADARLADAGPGFRGVALAHNVRRREEVDAVLAEAERAGGRITRPAQDAFWGGYYGHFTDPEGHVWEVAWNPQFAIDGAGNITLPR